MKSTLSFVPAVVRFLHAECNNDCVSCEICHIRKEKRFCPAVHGRICPTCCGTEREVTLDCPSECPYLQQARRNEKPRSMDEIDREALFASVEIPESFIYEREPLIVGLSFGIVKAARADHTIADRDAIAALSSLAKSYETMVGSGLVYRETNPSLPQQAIIAEQQKLVEDYRKLEQERLGYVTLRDSDVLKALVFLVRLALGRNNGRPRSRAFLDFLFALFPEKQSVISSPAEASRIIMP